MNGSVVNILRKTLKTAFYALLPVYKLVLLHVECVALANSQKKSHTHINEQKAAMTKPNQEKKKNNQTNQRTLCIIILVWEQYNKLYNFPGLGNHPRKTHLTFSGTVII